METIESPKFSNTSALTDGQILQLTYIYLSALSLSLLGSGSVFAVTVVKGRCFNDQVRPLVQLALADFLAAAAALLSMAIIQLLPPHLFIFAYYLCPYGVILAMMFYNVSFLMVMVYAYETNRAIKGWREMSIADVQISVVSILNGESPSALLLST
ncbi:uncharacterized protein SI:DKEY-30C15.2 [Latimeria chalumnae]|uniref:uncharacterized protein SI:DKEY-30C15.2 n=1 Tax=Latimeria chalumnae TaxID=7897 RepID=UPI00313AC90F